MPELTIAIYVLIMVVTIWLGVRVYGRWINHITIYGVVWGTQIILFQMKFIAYPNLSSETIIFIFGAWTVFVVASLTFRSFYSGQRSVVKELPVGDNNVLLVILLGVTLIGAAGVYQHWTILLKMFGSVKNVIVNANILYSFRRKEAGIPGMWPYVDSISLSADFLGGYFAGMRRRPILFGILPLIVELLNAIAAFGRSRLVIGAILWSTAFFLPQMKKQAIDPMVLRKRIILLASVLLIFIFGMEFVRTFRGVNESLSGESRSLSRLKGIGFVTPSIYLYLSSDVAVLNKFLNYEFSGITEQTPVGGNTFAPFYRIFAKFDLTPSVLEYQKSYTVPVSTNTGSYLRELYADWGIFGAMVAVYLLGALCSVALEAYLQSKSLVLLAIISHLYVVVFFTFAVQATRLGYWVVSLIIAVIGSLIIEKLSAKNNHEMPISLNNGDKFTL